MTSPQESYRTIPLTKGQVALVDEEDYERLCAFKWCAYRTSPTRGFYAVRNFHGGRGKSYLIRMHREVVGLDRFDEREVDHKNLDTLDNRRLNLRIATTQQNAFNRKKGTRNVSGYKGVNYVEKRQRWRARIGIDWKTVTLGYFLTAEEAYAAYCAAAEKLHGEFARLA